MHGLVQGSLQRDPVLNLSAVRSGWASPTTLAVFTSVLRGLGPISALRIDSELVLTMSDDNGRERSLRMWDQREEWDLANIWSFLSRDYDAHKSLRVFSVSERARGLLGRRSRRRLGRCLAYTE